MAATKKAEATATAKAGERVRIEELQIRVKAACNKVPQSVVNGTYQQAVEWKALALETFSGASVQHEPAKGKSLAELQEQSAHLESMLQRLVVMV